jgi:uncharacterized membrane protein YhaH (DUF805 family)
LSFFIVVIVVIVIIFIFDIMLLRSGVSWKQLRTNCGDCGKEGNSSDCCLMFKRLHARDLDGILTLFGNDERFLAGNVLVTLFD